MIVAIALSWLALAAPAAAQGTAIERAEAAFYRADFQRARAAFRDALAAEDLDRDTALRAHRHLAAVELVLDHHDRAEAHARAAVALSPDVAPPEGVSQVAALFELARDELGHRASEIVLDATEDDAERVVTARIDPVATELVAVLGLACGEPPDRPDPDAAATVRADQEARWSTAARGPLRCLAVARTIGGAILMEAERSFAALDGGGGDGDGEPVPGGGDDGGDEGGASIWPWVAVGAGVVALGIVVAVLAAGDGETVTVVDGVDIRW